jgi:hypothetical protein
VDWPAWEPLYRQILQDFGYSERADREAALLLDQLLDRKRLARDRDLRRLLEDRVVVVAGPALEGPLPRGEALISCDSAIEALPVAAHPDVIVTDLDGAVERQVKANACCALAVVHAHGDNLAALRAWVPLFPGMLVGTCQGEPLGALRNFGGFTDGDRAVFLAAHHDAANVILAGFDFDRPRPKEGRDPAIKARKLAWARKLVAEAGVPVELA